MPTSLLTLLGGFCLTLLLLFGGTASAATDDSRCAKIDQRQQYGPYDYRLRRGATKKNLKVVESFHFSAKVQRSALRGVPNPGIWWDLDYTLRAFPNHARALYLIGIYGKEIKKKHSTFLRNLEKSNAYSPPLCYFKRAARYAPTDPNVWNTLGRLQTRAEQHDLAIKSFLKVVELAPKSGSAHYNLGLAYFAAGRYAEAEKAANSAYSLGYRKLELRKRLAQKKIRE